MNNSTKATIDAKEDSASQNSRKRPREPSKLENATPKMASQDKSIVRIPNTSMTVKGMALEAIFHPKFENERQNNQDIRRLMLSNVLESKGYLEVSLKHSGSLLLWSGGQRYYSKNSTDNMFTFAGEILLRQHFARAWDDYDTETKYKECSEFIQRNRLTLSFEVVTAVMGDHGDIPNRDYLMLLSVANRNTGAFHSTVELLSFAQTFRLPHNDVWVFHTHESCSQLFALYDSSRETGLADYVVTELNKAADKGHSVTSMYPHLIFQGNILEGIVIRYVAFPVTVFIDSSEDSYTSKGRYLKRIAELSSSSRSILETVPPEKHSFLQSSTQTIKSIFTVNLRKIMSEEKGDASFMLALRSLLKASDDNRRKVERLGSLRSSITENIDLNSIAANIMTLKDEQVDDETKQIATLIDTINALHLPVSYNTFREEIQSDVMGEIEERFISIVHVHVDSAFQQYYKATKRSGNMMLYRGFSFELIKQHLGNGEESLSAKSPPPQLENPSVVDSSGKLMLKMKFLPYMVRTFICRNGLSILSNSGAASFNNYVLRQFKTWKMSRNAIETWMPFFQGWSLYCQSPPSVTSDGTPLPPLTSNKYLSHYNNYSHMYEKGLFQGDKNNEPSIFHGLIVIVAPRRNQTNSLAQALATNLGITGDVRKDVNGLTEEDMANSLLRSRQGIICKAEISDGFGKIRALGKRDFFSNHIHILMLGCSEREIEAMLLPQNELKRNKGMAKGWKKCKCNLKLDLTVDQVYDGDSVRAKLFECSKEIVQFLQCVTGLSKQLFAENQKYGALSFFVGIPGSGKSTICDAISSQSVEVGINRQIIVRESDKIKEKFYRFAKREKLEYPSSIYVADKNAPPGSWSIISDICTETKGIPIPILPDSQALKDTYISSEMEPGSGSIESCYPFTLHYLAVCMLRVLQRREDNAHHSKLGPNLEDACMIVVKFYCLYKNLQVSELHQYLESISKFQSKSVIAPFFKEDALPPLPIDLVHALYEAIQIQNILNLNGKKGLEESLKDIEKRLRYLLSLHTIFLEDLTVNESQTKESFISQLNSVISFVREPKEKAFIERKNLAKLQINHLRETASTAKCPSYIRFVGIDIFPEAIDRILVLFIERFPSVASFLKTCGTRAESLKNDDLHERDRLIHNTHVTMAHCSQMTQGAMRNTFGQLMGLKVELKVNAFLFSKNVAALDVSIKTEIARSFPQKNNFTHITVWCAGGVRAKESNLLPEEVISGNAFRVDLDTEATLEGEISLS